ncbi:hypothetical protein N7533_010990 [Penicillium manginii]|uniref:uncharacterized protein n=1 Tax=Penicillium manginii TaxID=203109 RepID=UPI00254907F8|nr:uncharacterized protein N7533_010990 [Penicillium manginii]KAJ5741581.1 hypothetical protein N7533_010990 [Penicillium manginii]
MSSIALELRLQAALQHATDLFAQAQRTPKKETFNQAINLTIEAKQCSIPNSEAYRYSVELLTKIYRQRHQAYGEISDLTAAIRHAEEVAGFNDISSRLAGLQNLSILQTDLFTETKQIDNAQAAFATARKAVELASGCGYDQVSCEANLAEVLLRLCQERLEVHEAIQIDYAVEKLEKVLESHHSHSEVVTWRHTLALLLRLKFERTGNTQYLDSGISQEQSSLAFSENHDLKRPRRLEALAGMLTDKFYCTGESQYLDDAEKMLRDAVRLSKTSPDSEKATYLNGLALTLVAKFQRYGKLDYVQESIKRSRSASSLERNIADKAKYLGCLANSLCLLYDQTKEEGTLSEALGIGETARETTIVTASHPYRLTCANILAKIHTRQFELHRDTHSFDQAICLFSEASNSWSQDAPSRAVAFINLGNLYYCQSDHRDLDKALGYFLQACRSTAIYTILRVKASQMAIGILESKGLYAEAIQIGDGVLHLVQELCDRSMNLSDQQYAVQQVAGLAAEVCSLHLQTGRASEGLQKLEFGRGLILRYMFDKHDSVQTLEQDHPNLAKEYKALLFRLSTADNESLSMSSQLSFSGHRVEAGEKLKRLLYRIRQMRGYESFLLEPSIDELRSCASGGTVVVVNATLVRADAIIIRSEGIRSIQLPVMEKSLAKWSSEQGSGASKGPTRGSPLGLRDAGSGTRAGNNKLFLKWLWDSCVKLVLKEVRKGSGLSADGNVPHIWWLGTGMAARFPFHAAGDYKHNLQENCLQQSMSSYTPSIRALAYACSLLQEPPHLVEPKDKSILVVTMPTTPGQVDLEGVRDECFAISSACKGIFKSTLLEHPTAAHVLGNLAKSEIVHFACHGLSNPDDPSKSHLLLQSNSESGDAIPDKLTIADICDTVSHGVPARIAYLSACSTAEITPTRYADESFHIASAFQVAGFPSVIGALWPTRDDVCVKVTKYFYESFVTNYQTDGKELSVASSYRDAVLRVRSELFAGGGEGDPMTWAAHVHLGL